MAEEREGVKSLGKALNILECVADGPDGAGVSEVRASLCYASDDSFCGTTDRKSVV